LISKSIWTRFGRGFGLRFGASATSKSDFNFDTPRFLPDFDGFRLPIWLVECLAASEFKYIVAQLLE